jgi:hypothetical protein
MPVIYVTMVTLAFDDLMAGEPDAVVDTMPVILDLIGDDAVFGGTQRHRPGRTSIQGCRSGRCS